MLHAASTSDVSRARARMTLVDLASPRIAAFAIDVVRLTLWLALLAACFVPLEYLFTRGLERPARTLVPDLAYYFLNSLLPGIILAVPIAMLANLSQRLLPAAYTAWLAGFPFALKLAVAVVVGEIGIYWAHRLSHEIPFLWRFHAIHHAPQHLNWLVNTRAHPIDMVFTRICGLAPIYLLGLQPSGSGGTMLPVIVTLVATVWAFFIHADLRWRFGPLEYLVATPGFHHWHHTNDGNINKNYAALLPMLDVVFGTLHLPRSWPPCYGINETMAPTVTGQLLHPLKPASPASPSVPTEHLRPAP